VECRGIEAQIPEFFTEQQLIQNIQSAGTEKGVRGSFGVSILEF
jgi:hypothetical protein